MKSFPMKILLLSLCAGWLLAPVPCRAQSAAADPAPLLLVYLVNYGENTPPRIALGLEKPALRIGAFEKCVRISTLNPKLGSLAAQLKPDDAKTLVAAMKSMAAAGATTLPRLFLWFATPDNKILGWVDSLNNEANILKAGVIEFDPDEQETICRFLTEKGQVEKVAP